MIEQALFLQLRDATAVDAIVGGDSVARIYPHSIPQKSRAGASRVPAIVYDLRGQERDQTYCGTHRLVRSSFSVASFDVSMKGAMQLAAEVRGELMDYSGQMGGLVHVRHVSLDGQFSIEDMEPGLFRVEQTYVIWHTED